MDSIIPVNASDLLSPLTGNPLLKTSLVNIIPTSCFAPHYRLVFSFKRHEANRTVPVNFFADPLSVACRSGLRRILRRILENLAQLLVDELDKYLFCLHVRCKEFSYR